MRFYTFLFITFFQPFVRYYRGPLITKSLTQQQKYFQKANQTNGLTVCIYY